MPARLEYAETSFPGDNDEAKEEEKNSQTPGPLITFPTWPRSTISRLSKHAI
jgi:hypothetical protein